MTMSIQLYKKMNILDQIKNIFRHYLYNYSSASTI